MKMWHEPVDWNVINDMIFAIPVRILEILVFSLPSCPSPTLYIEVNSKRASVKLTARKLINFGVSMEKLWSWRIRTCFLLTEAKFWRLGAEHWDLWSSFRAWVLILPLPSAGKPGVPWVRPGPAACKEAWEFFQEKHNRVQALESK